MIFIVFIGIDERFAVPKAFLRTGKTTAKISACVACGNSVLIFYSVRRFALNAAHFAYAVGKGILIYFKYKDSF